MHAVSDYDYTATCSGQGKFTRLRNLRVLACKRPGSSPALSALVNTLNSPAPGYNSQNMQEGKQPMSAQHGLETGPLCTSLHYY